ncbi:unspecific monooxygenase [Teladorsagia circumcincta]|uniref:Unspecific monooxygenase n=1 Tax=Teladorsagia circumcincta TaxID=45464 RepID=A0A2G9UHD6_TELCI|nr:unspecific monooxygenase [Teladorsagia circumcincta]
MARVTRLSTFFARLAQVSNYSKAKGNGPKLNSMALAPIILAVIVVALLFYWKQIYTLIQERLRLIKHVDKIPGPFSIPILGLALQLREWGTFYADQGHGIVRMWMATRPMVICIRPETAKLILERSDTITKGEEYGILTPWLGTGLLISTGDKWRTRRKLLTPAFHFTVLNEFQVIHDRQAKIFVGQLEKMVSTDKEFDIFPFVKRCALDIICETAMGCHISAQKNHQHPYVESVRRLNELAFLHERMPWMWIQAIWYATSYGFEYDRHLKIVTDFTRKVINERIAERGIRKSESGEKKKAFLDLLLDVQAEGDLSYEDIREEVDTFMFEGSSDRSCTAEDLKSMKYLEKCIKESLRLRPPVPNFTRKLEQDIDIEGVMIPKGCSILITPAMIHGNPKVYKDPYVFDPERFSDENIQKRHPYAYIPFSAGQKFALLEEKTVLSWFFRRFSITSRLPMESNMPLPEIILKPSLGFPVLLSKR